MNKYKKKCALFIFFNLKKFFCVCAAAWCGISFPRPGTEPGWQWWKHQILSLDYQGTPINLWILMGLCPLLCEKRISWTAKAWSLSLLTHYDLTLTGGRLYTLMAPKAMVTLAPLVKRLSGGPPSQSECAQPIHSAHPSQAKTRWQIKTWASLECRLGSGEGAAISLLWISNSLTLRLYFFLL